MRRALPASFAAGLVLAACSSSTDGGDSGTSTNVASPQAIVKTNGGESGACLPAFALGSFEPSRPVRDGAQDGSAQVRVQCTVAPSSDGFLVHAAISANDMRGTFGFDVPKMPSSGNVTASPADVVVVWGSSEGGYSWGEAPTCKLDTGVRAASGIAAGRYWASFVCTGLKTRDARPCTLLGEIRLENCAQTF